MIVDIINELYSELKSTLTDVNVFPAYPNETPSFPCLVIEEVFNTSRMDTHDSSGYKHSDINIEINIFSDAENKIGQVKDIRDRVDAIMNDKYNMARDDSRPVTNLADSNIYRYILRYSFSIDSNKKIYRR